MHTHLEFELGRMGAEEMRTEIGRNRLESRLAKARRAENALPEEIGPVRRGMVSRAIAVIMGFRKSAKAPIS